MKNRTERTPRSEAFRLAIAAFIDERREAKLKGKEPDTDAVSKYDYGSWLADAAHRASQIQVVKHVLKATHPDARGSSLHVSPKQLRQHTEVGTHLLGEDFVEDVTNNAASLYVFKFMKIEVDGQRLFNWVRAKDEDLAQALHEDPATAKTWMSAFGGLVRQNVAPVSHALAKQVYWLAGDDAADDSQFHLLQPLFSSSLVHAVHEDIREARFGEINTALRTARQEKKAAEGVNREYSGLAARKFGASAKSWLNISQLNGDRRGVNYLLPSLPPEWKSAEGPRLAGRTSAIEVFGRQRAVRELIAELAAFLKTDPPTNMPTRLRREGIEQALGAQLPVFAEHVRKTRPLGWTRDATCELPECEKLWLDPGRADPEQRGTDHLEQDQAFERAYHWGDWPDEVASRFANWVNAQLRAAGIEGLGDAEYHHWGKQAIVEAAWPVPLQRRAVGVPA